MPGRNCRCCAVMLSSMLVLCSVGQLGERCCWAGNAKSEHHDGTARRDSPYAASHVSLSMSCLDESVMFCSCKTYCSSVANTGRERRMCSRFVSFELRKVGESTCTCTCCKATFIRCSEPWPSRQPCLQYLHTVSLSLHTPCFLPATSDCKCLMTDD